MRSAAQPFIMSRRAHLTWRLLALGALVVATASPRHHPARTPARVELLSASLSLGPEISAQR